MLNTHKTLIAETLNETIAVLRLHRPEAANAINTDMAMDIIYFFTALEKSPLRCLILTGSGRHFCAGADLKDRKGMDEAAWHTQHQIFEEAHRTIVNCKIPVIAAVNGAAMGGGLELAMACDFIVAADTARFGLTETTLGIMPGLGGTQLLPRKIGTARAAELIYMGKPFSAAEAFHWGLVNHLYPDAELMPNAIALATNISHNAPLAIQAVKRAMHEGATQPLHEALQCELDYYYPLLNTQDRTEGINAFNEKRKATFTGN